MSERTPPPAGWYDDPSLVNTRRYWDGQKWTEHRQEKPSSPTPPVLPPTNASSGVPKWAVTGFGLLLAVVALWLFVGNGWQTITGSGTTIDVDEMTSQIQTDLASQDFPGFTLTCDDPGEVTKGDVTYCRGKNKQGIPVSIKVTFDDDGAYSWESR